MLLMIDEKTKFLVPLHLEGLLIGAFLEMICVLKREFRINSRNQQINRFSILLRDSRADDETRVPRVEAIHEDIFNEERKTYFLNRRKTKNERLQARLQETVEFKKVKVAAARKMKLEKRNLMSVDELNQFFKEKSNEELKKVQRLTNAINNSPRVCVDLSFDGEHSDKERKSLWKQLLVSYATNKKSLTPVQLMLTSFRPKSETAEGLRALGLQGWTAVTTHQEAPWELFPLEDIVVLSPDATEALECVDEHKVS